MISLPKVPYMHRIYMVLANPKHFSLSVEIELSTVKMVIACCYGTPICLRPSCSACTCVCAQRQGCTCSVSHLARNPQWERCYWQYTARAPPPPTRVFLTALHSTTVQRCKALTVIRCEYVDVLTRDDREWYVDVFICDDREWYVDVFICDDREWYVDVFKCDDRE